MNRSQETRLQYLNDNYGVASWEERRGSVFVTLDDGDRAEIHPEGTATFESGETHAATEEDAERRHFRMIEDAADIRGFNDGPPEPDDF